MENMVTMLIKSPNNNKEGLNILGELSWIFNKLNRVKFGEYTQI